MSRLLAIFLICVMPLTALAEKTYGSVTIAEVTSIYDGDTFIAKIPDYPPIIGQHIGIRINGVDTPEMRGKCEQEKVLARKAKQYTVTKLRNAKKIELRNMKRGKYFRIVADVYADGINIGDGLVKDGLAVVYNGGKKSKHWCN
jgi:micrococcal nuclease